MTRLCHTQSILCLCAIASLLLLLGSCCKQTDLPANVKKGSKSLKQPCLLFVTYGSDKESRAVPSEQVAALSLEAIDQDSVRYQAAKDNFNAKIAKGETPKAAMLPSVYYFGDHRFCASVLLCGKDNATSHYQLSIARDGVAFTFEDISYSGEDFKVIARGQDWYAAFANVTSWQEKQ